MALLFRLDDAPDKQMDLSLFILPLLENSLYNNLNNYLNNNLYHNLYHNVNNNVNNYF